MRLLQSRISRPFEATIDTSGGKETFAASAKSKVQVKTAEAQGISYFLVVQASREDGG
jgi:hypothetical protein